jgi:hypothetical protein
MEAAPTHKELAMLRILYGACATALDTFRAADNPVDEQLVVDLEVMVTRTEAEIERHEARFRQSLLAASRATPRG